MAPPRKERGVGAAVSPASSEHAAAAAAQAPAPVPAPAILAHPSTDLFSLAICGYLGGRFVLMRTAGVLVAWSWRWGFAGVAAAFVTTFGGGTFYAFLMQRRGARGFGWMDPLNLLAALVGYGASCVLPLACESGARLQELIVAECGLALRFFDCANNSILIAWGASKSSVDASGARTLPQAGWTLLATYLYSFGGGITRDAFAMALGVVQGVNNFAPEIVLPAVAGTLFYHCLLRFGSPPLLQLGLGMPAVFYMFYKTPALLSQFA